jgi:hypothetical protein
MTQRKNGECAKETNTKAQPTEIHQAKKNMSDYILMVSPFVFSQQILRQLW